MDIPIRRLISPAKRLIISGGSPIIPHDELAGPIKILGIKPVSNITFLNANMPIDTFRHIGSFNRQVYAEVSPQTIIPGSFLIRYEEENYRFYIDYAQQKCFKCKNIGHKILECPLNNIEDTTRAPITYHDQNTNEEQNNTIDEQPQLAECSEADTENQENEQPSEALGSTSETDKEGSDSEEPNEDETEENQQIKTKTVPLNINSELGLNSNPPEQYENEETTNTQAKKRALSTSTEGEQSQERLIPTKKTITAQQVELKELQINLIDIAHQQKQGEDKNIPTNNPRNIKRNQAIEEMMTSVEPIIRAKPDEYIFSYSTLKKFIKETKTKTDPEILQITKVYSRNKPLEVYHMLDTLYHELEYSKIKQRFTKIMNIIIPDTKQNDEPDPTKK